MGIDSLCAEGVGGVGSEDVVVCGHVNHIQNAGRSHVGSNEDTVSGGTLSAVAGDRTHGEVLLTDALGQEGGGSTAVAVGGPLTAQSQHGLTQLVGAEADGVVGAAAVVHTDDQGTVLLDTDHGTGGGGAGALLLLVDQLAVLDGHGEGDRDCVEQDALIQVVLEVDLVVGLNIARDVALCILEHVQDGRGGGVLTLDTDILTVVDQDTGSVGVVVQVGVHTADDVVPEVILIVLSHLGQLLMRPVGLIGQILVDLIVAGNNRNVGVRRIHLDDVEDLSAVACRVVQNDFRFNGSAGDEDVILLGDYVVVTVGTKGLTVVNNVGFFPVRNGCERGKRNDAHEHEDRQKNGYCASDCLASHFHVSFFFIISTPFGVNT